MVKHPASIDTISLSIYGASALIDTHTADNLFIDYIISHFGFGHYGPCLNTV